MGIIWGGKIVTQGIKNVLEEEGDDVAELVGNYY